MKIKLIKQIVILIKLNISMASPMCIQSTFCSKSNLGLFLEGGSGHCTSINCKNFCCKPWFSQLYKCLLPFRMSLDKEQNIRSKVEEPIPQKRTVSELPDFSLVPTVMRKPLTIGSASQNLWITSGICCWMVELYCGHINHRVLRLWVDMVSQRFFLDVLKARCCTCTVMLEA